MLETFEAILRVNVIEWSGDRPPELPPDQPVRVHVTLLDKVSVGDSPASQGQRMAAALERLAANRSLLGIADPSAWQREIREDRPLPGRDP